MASVGGLAPPESSTSSIDDASAGASQVAVNVCTFGDKRLWLAAAVASLFFYNGAAKFTALSIVLSLARLLSENTHLQGTSDWRPTHWP